MIKTHKTVNQKVLIDRLNPIIRGWSNYYSGAASKEIFTGIDRLVYQKLRAWANRRHPKKNKEWISNRYWLLGQGEGWTFGTSVKGKIIRLKKHSATPIVRHVKVQRNRSPDDGDLIYWSTRMARHPEVLKSVTTLLKRQLGKCAHCGLTFKDGDLKEKDHMISRHKGGTDKYNNLQLLHRHCHEQKTAHDAVGTKRARQKLMPPQPNQVKRSV